MKSVSYALFAVALLFIVPTRLSHSTSSSQNCLGNFQDLYQSFKLENGNCLKVTWIRLGRKAQLLTPEGDEISVENPQPTLHGRLIKAVVNLGDSFVLFDALGFQKVTYGKGTEKEITFVQKEGEYLYAVAAQYSQTGEFLGAYGIQSDLDVIPSTHAFAVSDKGFVQSVTSTPLEPENYLARVSFRDMNETFWEARFRRANFPGWMMFDSDAEIVHVIGAFAADRRSAVGSIVALSGTSEEQVLERPKSTSSYFIASFELKTGKLVRLQAYQGSPRIDVFNRKFLAVSQGRSIKIQDESLEERFSREFESEIDWPVFFTREACFFSLKNGARWKVSLDDFKAEPVGRSPR